MRKLTLYGVTALCVAMTALPPGHANPTASRPANSGQRDSTATGRDGLAGASAAENVALELGVGDVTPSGAYGWELPLEVPMGRQGVAPALSVAYDSQMQNGLLGMGFTLRGLPAVVRIPHQRGLAYDGQDHYALASGGWGVPVSPGKRLVRQGTSNVFHTLEESWVELEELGSCGGGPCVWRMKDGKGNTLYFGTSAGSALDKAQQGNGSTAGGKRAWALSRFEDAHGNSYQVTYRADSWMMYPERIEYGCTIAYTPPGPTPPPPTTIQIPDPSTGPTLVFDTVSSGQNVPPSGFPMTGGMTLTPSFGTTTTITVPPPTTSITISTTPTAPTVPCSGERELVFAYSTRSDGTALPGRYEQRLASVSMYSNNTALRRYVFNYDTSGPRSRLTSVDRLGADFATGLPRIQVTWSATPSLPTSAVPAAWFGTVAGVRTESHAGDVNGDGFDDVVRVSHGWNERRIEWALGSASGLGARQTAVDAVGASHFSSLLADVNGDGKKDLISWAAAASTVEVWVGLGTATGLAARTRVYQSTTAINFPGNGSYARAVPVDGNGDLIADLMLINQETRVVMYFRGTSAGLAAPVTLSGLSAATGATIYGEPVITDLNGDEFFDVVMPISANDIHLCIWFGGVNGPQRAVKHVYPGGARWTPFQALAGDFNGDGFGDVTLAFTGQPEVSNTPIPYGRDIRTFYGRADAGVSGVALATATLQGNPNPALPMANFPNWWSAWQHHSADINGDGATDIVAAYHGVMGERVQWLLGRPQGGFLAVAERPAGGGLADGNEAVHRWQTRIADVDGDGRDDLARWYVGASRTILDVFPGTATGLGAPVRITDQATGDAPNPTTAASASSISLLVPDVNGDGRPDLLLSTWSRLLGFNSTPAPVDRVVAIANGFGGVTRISYESAPRLPSVVQPSNTTCGGTSPLLAGVGAACGIAYGAPRPLVTRVTVEDGRDVVAGDVRSVHATSYAYDNGRFVPGPVAPRTGVAVRADLGFQTIVRTDDRTGLVTRTRYRQLWPLQGSTLQEEREQPTTPGAATRQLVRRDTWEHALVTTGFATTASQIRSHLSETFENNVPGKRVRHTFTYNAWGAVQTDTECAPETPGGADLCVEKRIDYAEDAVALPAKPAGWVLNRATRERTRVAATQLVLDWTEHTYLPTRPTLRQSTRRLQCLEAELCTCWSNAATCTNAGARWVTTAGALAYDTYGNLTSATDALGRVATFTYDPVFATLPATSSRTVTTGGSPQVFTDARTYDAAGRVLTQTDPGGRVTRFAYDNVGRRRRVDHPGGAWETFEYLGFGSPSTQRVRHTRAVDVVAGVTRTLWRDQWFDGEGTVYLDRRQGDGSATVDVRREAWYQGGKKVVLASLPHFTGAADVIWIQTEHDAQNRPLAFLRRQSAARFGAGTTLATLRTVSYQADGVTTVDNHGALDASTGAIVSNVWRTTRQRYTSRGKLFELVDALGHVTRYTYDEAQRPIFVEGPLGSPQGHPWTSWIYDGWGRPALVSDEASGETLYRYDDGGRLLEQTDALGRSTAWTYDELDRPRTRTSDSGTVTWTYDAAGVPHGRGRPTGTSDAAGQHDVLAYDAAGNVLSRRTTMGSASFSETMRYDLSDRLVRHVQPNGRALTWSYSQAGHLLSVAVDGTIHASYSGHDAEGRATSRSTLSAVSVYNYGRDGKRSFAWSKANALSATDLQYLSYRWDAAGNLLGATDGRSATLKAPAGGVNTDASWTYAYDALSRLTSATPASGPATTYSYDADGDLTGAAGMSIDSSGREVDAAFIWLLCPQPSPFRPAGPCTSTRQNVWHASRDDAGQIYKKTAGNSTWDYVWNAEGKLRETRLNGASQATFTYDAQGRRRIKTISAAGVAKTTVYYVSPSYEVRVQGSAVSVSLHVPGAGGERVSTVVDRPLDGQDDAATIFGAIGKLLTGRPLVGAPLKTWTYLADHLGSVQVVLDDRGAEVTRYTYGPWGEVNGVRSTGRDLAPHGFTGQERDVESGLVHFKARQYDPQLMRFLTPDALVPGGGLDARGLNRYAYAADNPVSLNDPSGLCPPSLCGPFSLPQRIEQARAAVKAIFWGLSETTYGPLAQDPGGRARGPYANLTVTFSGIIPVGVVARAGLMNGSGQENDPDKFTAEVLTGSLNLGVTNSTEKTRFGAGINAKLVDVQIAPGGRSLGPIGGDAHCFTLTLDAAFTGGKFEKDVSASIIGGSMIFSSEEHYGKLGVDIGLDLKTFEADVGGTKLKSVKRLRLDHDGDKKFAEGLKLGIGKNFELSLASEWFDTGIPDAPGDKPLWEDKSED